jgi:hypothetical protein
VKIVGLISSYLEGRLLDGAMRSIDRVGLDDLLVFEGPAGDPLEADVPESEFPRGVQHVSKHGRWRTDARKRNELLAEAKRRNPGPLWGVWLDGDEILVDGEYLRDQLQDVVWNDEHEGGEPTIRQPLWVVEADGSMAFTNSRIVRLDLIQSYDISVSVVTNQHGIEEAWGNTNPDSRFWLELWMRAVESGRMLAWPPHSCQPHIYHRSNLRHPDRRGLRLHKQEADELKKAGKL